MRRYDASMLEELLGPDFTLLEIVDHIYHQPSGDARPYVYALFQRATEAATIREHHGEPDD